MRVTSRKQRRNKAKKAITTQALMDSYGNKKQREVDDLRTRLGLVVRKQWHDTRAK